MISKELTTNSNTSVSKKINFHTAFWSNFFMNIRKLKKILIVMCVLHILGLPLLMISGIASEIDDSGYSMYGFIPLSMCCLAIALIMGFIIALNSFDYLYKKTKVDMIYSLPLTIKQRFLSDYFSGLCSYIIPYIASVILTFIIHGLAYFGINSWEEFTKEEHFTYYMIQLCICGLLVMIMFYTLTVLVTSCCGSMFESIAYNLLVNCLIPGVIAIFFAIFFSGLYGISIDDYILKYISNSSPLGAIIGITETIDGEISQLIRLYILTLVTDVIYFFIAYFLYSKRKAEDVSKPFVFKAFYYITMTAITFIIIALMVNSDTDYIAPLMFLSAIVYFICETIANRGFKKFGWSVLRYIVTVFGVIVLCLILNGTNGFGIESRIPSALNVKSVTIDYGGVYQNYSSDVTFKDRESIETVINFHKDAVENRFNSYLPDEDADIYQQYGILQNYIYYSDYYQYVHITYNTRLGGKISREYKVSFEQYMMLKDLSLNESYIEQCASDFLSDLLSNYTTYRFSYYNIVEQDTSMGDYNISVSSKIQVNSKEYDHLTYSQIMELAECYKKDLENRTMDDILTPTDTYCYLNSYIILSSYENTIKFLTENNLTPPTIETELLTYTSYDYSYYGDCILYAPDDITCVGGDYYTSIDAYKATYGRYLTVSISFLPLLEVAQPCYVTTDECYILSFNGDMFVIPKEYSNIAKEYYDIAKEYDNDNDYLFQSTANRYEYNYLTCYLNTHDIWKEHFTKTYDTYKDFVENLLYGYVDIFTDGECEGTINAEDFNTLQEYYSVYWTIYYDDYLQTDWNNWGNRKYSNYDDFVWYILMYTFNNSSDTILFNDDIETSNDSTESTTTFNEESSKIDSKPIDENLSNI